MLKKIYLIGSLRNSEISKLGNTLRAALPGTEIFNDWLSAGPEADDYWKSFEEARSRNYKEALASHPAKHVFEFDKHHLDDSDAAILALPAGRSGHLELGYMAGKGKFTAILLDEVSGKDRWDVMYQFADVICETEEDLVDALTSLPNL